MYDVNDLQSRLKFKNSEIYSWDFVRQQKIKKKVLSLSRECPFPEWLLLELPSEMWAAFWHSGLDCEHATAVANGKYRGACAYISKSKDRVLKFMSGYRKD